MDFNYLKKNQTKPEVSRLLSNVCDLPKRKLGLWERNPYPREWIYKSIENLQPCLWIFILCDFHFCSFFGVQVQRSSAVNDWFSFFSIPYFYPTAQSRRSARLFLQSSVLGLPHPPPHSQASLGVGVPIPTRGQTLWYSRFICTLCLTGYFWFLGPTWVPWSSSSRSWVSMIWFILTSWIRPHLRYRKRYNYIRAFCDKSGLKFTLKFKDRLTFTSPDEKWDLF